VDKEESTMSKKTVGFGDKGNNVQTNLFHLPAVETCELFIVSVVSFLIGKMRIMTTILCHIE
jgi:hypothetical protein